VPAEGRRVYFTVRQTADEMRYVNRDEGPGFAFAEVANAGKSAIR
jgi:hypothetical protein